MRKRNVFNRDIKAIFFDIGYTLCEPVTGDWRATPKFYEYFKPEYFQKLEKEKIKKAFMAGYEVLNNTKQVKTLQEELQLNIESYKAMADILKEINLSDENIFEIAKDRTYNMKNYAFYNDVIRVVSQLKQKYKIGIISDTWPSADDMLKEVGIYEYIDSFTYSCYLGTEKPDARMYLNALDDLNVKAENSVFIDDSIKNLEAAKE